MKILISTFLELRPQSVVIDVRTPAEFKQGHIAGSVNIPLFTDEERVVVGTLYKKMGKDAAIDKGLEFVGPRMATMVSQARKLYNGNPLLLYCWRGGMRSNSVAWLFNTAGIEAHTVVGGYKSYRREFGHYLQKTWNYIVVGGATGSGKTDLLKALETSGNQVIDLEGLAHHKGSSFGAIGELPQPSTEQFENMIFEKMLTFDIAKPVWLENESRTIGKVFIPQKMFADMEKCLLIRLQVPLETRVKRLVRDYTLCNKEDLLNAVERITKRLGGVAAKRAKEAIEVGDFALAAEILLAYYDKTYEYGFAERKSEKREIVWADEALEEMVGRILEF
ncbi:MAG: tRNA 2-selenouridine(34) synthase MnmH, partial [Breznakibacter sp.]|nr:tRNA 2-selenouridine(34) synthase MnmH [Breznakibacter sp.]